MKTSYGKAELRPSGSGIDVACLVKECTWHIWFQAPTEISIFQGFVRGHFAEAHPDITMLQRFLDQGVEPHEYGRVWREYEYGPVDVPCCEYSEKSPIHHAEEVCSK